MEIFSAIREVGEASHRNAISISDTPTQLTLSAGKKSVEIRVTGNNIVYYGGSNVNSSNGIPLRRREMKIWNNCQSGFSVYLVCESGKTSEVRVVEYA